MTDDLPAVADHAEVVRSVPVPRGRFRDLAHDLQSAGTVLHFLNAGGMGDDIGIALQTAVTCTGATAAEALSAAATFAQESPLMQVHALAWARLQGPVEGSDEYQVTMTVSWPDARGEYSGSTNLAQRPKPD